MKTIKWICPYCYSRHTDIWIRCVGCGTKRLERFYVDSALFWMMHPVDNGQTLGTLQDKKSKKGELLD